MKQYLDLLDELMNTGIKRDDRTGTGTLSKFGHQMRFNLQEGFPLLTTKKLFIPGIVDELLWIISGSTNAYDLPERTQKWWTPWADEDGGLGRVYGSQMRTQIGVNKDGRMCMKDQLADAIKLIRSQPNSRRILINLWHSVDMDSANLPCCHGSIIQFAVLEGRLHCHMYQRSCDSFIGMPVNIASYALFTHMVAQQCDLEVGDLIWSGGDVHLYLNHIEQAQEQLTRSPMQLPHLMLNKVPTIDDYTYDDIVITGYASHPAIKAEVSV